MLLCPACNHILNAAGCQACGWKTGDRWPAHRLMQGSAHPLKARDLYPPATGTVNVAVVVEPEPVAIPEAPENPPPPASRTKKKAAETVQ